MSERQTLRAGMLLGAALLAACAGPLASADSTTQVREPAVAGQFYPADRTKLAAVIDGMMAAAVPNRGRNARVIIVPHAGYLYSGQIAADGFNQTARSETETVVILGTNHTTAGFDKVSVYDGTAVRTPLGETPVDRGLAAALTRYGSVAVLDRRLHEREHSVEVQIPFVQRLFPKAAIVPVVVSSSDPDICMRFGRLLAESIGDRRVLVVASSDLSHYPRAGDAVREDTVTLRRIAAMDVAALVRAELDVTSSGTANLVTRACGLGAILVAIETAKRLGATHGDVVSYANSSFVAVGTPDRVVGYGAVAFAEGGGAPDLAALDPPKPDTSRPLDAADKRVLLTLARETVTRFLTGNTLPLPRGGSPALLREAGVFVTLRKHGDLRGCIGRLNPDGPLIRATSTVAYQSAFEDSRFSPVRASELGAIEIEVSVLTPMSPVAGPQAVVPGRDGVVLQAEGRSAVFLPQVATEEGWGRDELLDNLALKAGLRRDAWRLPGARLLTFQADVFAESRLK